nr:GW dipeptide domain-containing protein [Mammaliicoccus sp. Marseille-Q6498]
MDKKFYYKTPALVAMTLAGTTIVSHQAHAEQTTNNEDSNIIEQHDNAKQIKKEQKELKSQSLNVSGSKEYKDPSIIDEPNANQNVNKEVANVQPADNSTTDKTAVTNKENTSSEDTVAQDNTNGQPADNSTTDKTAVTNKENTASEDTVAQDNTNVQPTENSTTDKTDVANKENTASQDTVAQDNTNVQPTENSTTDKTDVTNKENTASQDTAAQDNTNVQPTDNSTTDKTAVTNKENTASQDTVAQDNTNVQPAENSASDQTKTNNLENKTNEATEAQPEVRTSLFRAARNVPTTYKATVTSKVNSQIRNNKYTVPKYVEDYSSHIPKIPYRKGVGKPEGVIAHETANPYSTIHNEVAYMKNNYENAFVHAFVDDKNIIEVAPTDYIAWGAGAQANPRFIHVELVRVYGGDRFARSINNYADYISTNLAYYGLPFDNADNDGSGTLWSHGAVSKYLGGTDHNDPYDWFAQNNYSFNELVDLVREKYQYKMGALTTPTQPSKPVVTKPTKPVVTKPTTPVTKPKPTTPTTTTPAKTVGVNYVGKVNTNVSGVYSTVYDKNTKSAANKAGKTFKIGKQSTYNNQVFYLLQDNKGTPLGWVKASDVQLQSTATPKPTKPAVTKPKPTTPVSKPKPVVTKPSTPEVKPKPTTSPVKTVNVNYVGKVNTNVSGVYSTVYDKNSKSAANKAGKTFKIGKQSTYNNQVFYLLQDNKGTPLGWVKASDVQLQSTATPKPTKPAVTKPKPTTPVSKPKPVVTKPSTPEVKPKPTTSPVKTVNVNYVGKVNTNVSGVYSTVYDKNSKSAANKAGKTFKIAKQATYNNQVFYLLQDNKGTSLGWVKSNDVQLQSTATPKPTTSPVKTVNVNYVGKVNTNVSGVYSTVYDKNSKSAANKAGKTFKIAKQATYNNQVFYLLQDNKGTPLGWVKSNDVQLQSTAAPKPVKGTANTVKVNLAGKLNKTITGVYTSVYDKKTVPATYTTGKTYKIGKQSTYNNQVFYLLQDNNAIPLGWVKANDIQLQNSNNTNTASKPTTVKPSKTDAIKVSDVNNKPIDLKESYTNYLIFDGKGYFYSQPTVSKDTLLGSLQNYQNAYFKVISSKKVGNTTWYKGILNGKTVWIDSKYLQLAEVSTNITKSPYTLDQAVNKQMALRNGSEPKKVLSTGIRNATRAEVKDAMDTSKYANDPVQKYQFLDLNKSQNIAVSKLNNLLRGKGILENQGEAFSQAAKAVGINEIYLISHALLETGNGTSQLAKGGAIDSKGNVNLNSKTKYYNMFGVGATDNNALYGGINYAQLSGWNSPAKAILGGAQFISKNYIKAGQNTLYKMRFNPQNPGTHQYATGIDFAKSSALRISDFYQQIQTDGQYFDVDQYK